MATPLEPRVRVGNFMTNLLVSQNSGPVALYRMRWPKRQVGGPMPDLERAAAIAGKAALGKQTLFPA
jgi:hypothetical protein